MSYKKTCETFFTSIFKKQYAVQMSPFDFCYTNVVITDVIKDGYFVYVIQVKMYYTYIKFNYWECYETCGKFSPLHFKNYVRFKLKYWNSQWCHIPMSPFDFRYTMISDNI